MRFSYFSPAFALGLLALVMVSCDRKPEKKSDEIVFKVAERDPRKIGQPQEPRVYEVTPPKAPDTMAEKYPEVASVVGIVKGVFSESADQVPQQKPVGSVAPEIRPPAATHTKDDLVVAILQNAPAIIDRFLKQRNEGEAGAGALDALGPEILDAILKNGQEISQEDIDAAQEAISKYGPVLEDLLKQSTNSNNGAVSGATADSIVGTILRRLLESGTKAPQTPQSQSNY